MDEPKFKLEDYNHLLNENDMLPEYADRIKEKYVEKISEYLGAVMSHISIDDVKYHLQSYIDTYKRLIYFVVTDAISNHSYRGVLIKNGGTTVRTLGEEYHFTTDDLYDVDDIVMIEDSIYICQTKEEFAERTKRINVKTEAVIDLGDDDEDEFTFNNPVVSNDPGEFLKLVNNMYVLFMIDKKSLMEKLKVMKMEMMLEQDIKKLTKAERKALESTYSFYEEMRSGWSIRKTQKNRVDKDTAKTRACTKYEIPEDVFQKYLSHRSAYRKILRVHRFD